MTGQQTAPVLIEVDSVTVHRPHQERPVLDAVSFTLHAGERVVLIGSNGSGKTTLTRLLNGTLFPDGGQVRVDGAPTTDATRIDTVRRCVGLLFQDADNQFVTTTAEREIAFGLENLQQDSHSMQRVVDQALEDFDLVRYRHTPPHEMSGGEKARLALACVWVMGPRLLVLDETDSLLDRRASERLQQQLQQLPATTAVLEVSTDPDQAAEADRILVVHEGRLVADGAPDDVWPRLSAEVTAHIGLPVTWRLSQRLGGVPTGSWARLLDRVPGGAALPEGRPR